MVYMVDLFAGEGMCVCTGRGDRLKSGGELVQANMFAPQDLMVILIIALILFRGKKLPEIGSSLGRAIREFKHATEEWQCPIEAAPPPAPPTALTPPAARPVGQAAAIERAEDTTGGTPETLEPGTRA
jgi:sec-independent protein translocase protein TatA